MCLSDMKVSCPFWRQETLRARLDTPACAEERKGRSDRLDVPHDHELPAVEVSQKTTEKNH